MNRSFVINAFALKLAFVLSSFAYAADAKQNTSSSLEGPASCNAPGRYVLVQHPTIRADQYLLDTCTGRVWNKVTYTDVKADVWQPIPRVDSEEELSKWQLQQILRASKNQGE